MDNDIIQKKENNDNNDDIRNKKNAKKQINSELHNININIKDGFIRNVNTMILIHK
jgi:hypothetical protein